MAERHRFVVGELDVGLRVDQVLARNVPTLSRALARRVLAEGGVFIDRKRVKVASRTLRPGQRVEVTFERPQAASQEAPADAGELIFQDEDMVVLNKPSGLPSAPDRQSDRNNALFLLEQRLQSRLYLVHRLDRPTSGVLAFARRPDAAEALGRVFQTHDLIRRYLVLMAGEAGGASVEVNAPIDGREARTRFAVEETFGNFTLRTAELFTGRTHQVRLHARALGCPVVGDRRYGGQVPGASRLMLHAALLELPHPRSGARTRFEAPVPEDMEDYIRQLRSQIPPRAPVLETQEAVDVLE